MLTCRVTFRSFPAYQSGIHHSASDYNVASSLHLLVPSPPAVAAIAAVWVLATSLVGIVARSAEALPGRAGGAGESSPEESPPVPRVSCIIFPSRYPFLGTYNSVYGVGEIFIPVSRVVNAVGH